MANILIWLNTYNREKLLMKFIKSVEKQKKDHQVDLFIFNDKSSDDYEDIKRHPLTKIFYSTNEHCGKQGYWKLINQGLDYIRQYQKEYDLFIKTDDDMIVCDDFFDLCLSYWKAIYTPKIFSLDILSAPRQRGKTLKGNNLTLLETQSGISFYQTQWVDMNFIFNVKAFDKIKFEIKNCRSGSRSSGVGLWFTNTFLKLGYSMYQCPHSLLIHKDHESKMHSEMRSQTPIVTQGLK